MDVEDKLVELEERMSNMEDKIGKPENLTGSEKRKQRLQIKKALDSGQYKELIEQGGHGLIKDLSEVMSKDLGFKVRYMVLYYLMRG